MRFTCYSLVEHHRIKQGLFFNEHVIYEELRLWFAPPYSVDGGMPSVVFRVCHTPILDFYAHLRVFFQL